MFAYKVRVLLYLFGAIAIGYSVNRVTGALFLGGIALIVIAIDKPKKR